MLSKAADRGLDAVLAVAENLPLKRRCLDFAYMVTVIEFLQEPLRALVAASGAVPPDAASLKVPPVQVVVVRAHVYVTVTVHCRRRVHPVASRV